MSVLSRIVEVESRVSAEHEGLYTFVNPYSYGLLRESAIDLSLFKSILIDGAGLVAVLRILGFKVQRRSFDMTSLAPVVFGEAEEKGLSVCLVGSRPEDIESAAKKISVNFPKIRLVLIRSGYFCRDEREHFLEKLVYESPDLVVVGMGAPLQEEFLVDLWGKGWRGVGFTCGGFFHQTASSSGIDYYPGWVDKLNLRFVYRMYQEPKLISRYFLDYPKNIFAIFADFLALRRGRKGSL